MSKKLYEESNIAAIATAIRSKNGSQDTYTTAEMADAIDNIETGGILVTKSITENGTYNALLDDAADGYSQVTVNVPSSSTSKIYKEYRNPIYYMDFTGLICAIGGRNYYKYNNKPAYVAYFTTVTGPVTMPMLVSKDPEAVKFYTSLDSTIFQYCQTITYNGELYYVSCEGYGMTGNTASTDGFATKLPDKFSSYEAAAETILDAVFSVVPSPVLFKTNGVKQVPTGYDGFGNLDIQVTNGGFVKIFYPKGASCTAVSGTETKTPGDTSGIWLFVVPMPETFPVTWTFSVDINNQTVSESITFYDAGKSHTIILTDQLDPISFLKQEFAKTDYARLSNNIGDTVNFNGRYFQRTSNEPILFINCRYRANGYYSYSCIALGTSAPAGTGNSYGGLGNAFSYDVKDIEVCSATMGGWWNGGNPVYYLDGDPTGITLSLDYSRPRINAQTQCIECEDSVELAVFMAKVYLLFSIVLAEQDLPSAQGVSF